MKKIYNLIKFLIMGSLLFSAEIPLNITIIPGINLIPGNKSTFLSTGLLSSEVYKSEGIQVGPIYSLSKTDVDGVQFAGVFNIVPGLLDGIQVSGVFNIANKVDGIQTGGVFNLASNLDGIQVGGVFNIAENIDGFQVGGLFNIAGVVNGFQSGGLYNISGDIDGFQVSGIYNLAGNLDGFQTSGVFNRSETTNGCQISLVNLASSGKLLQIGIINIVTEDSSGSLPIGLLNIYKNGTFDLSSWIDSKNNIYIALETGSKHFYTQLYSGSTKEGFKELDNRIYGSAIGLRFRDDLGVLDLLAGSKFMCNFGEKVLWIPDLKISIGYNLGPLTIFAGLTGNFNINGYNNTSTIFTNLRSININSNLDLYYDWFLGLRLQI